MKKTPYFIAQGTRPTKINKKTLERKQCWKSTKITITLIAFDNNFEEQI